MCCTKTPCSEMSYCIVCCVVSLILSTLICTDANRSAEDIVNDFTTACGCTNNHKAFLLLASLVVVVVLRWPIA